MNYNLHTHTYLCGHASGTPEEYIQKAIKCGIKHLGFSDHAPMRFPGSEKITTRMKPSDAPGYVAHLRELREKYKDQIHLHIGFEMEYYPSYFAEELQAAKDIGIEYLILGQHFSHEEGSGYQYVTAPIANEDDLKEHVAQVVEGIHSGVFTYVAHPDIFHFTGDPVLYQQEMRKICTASTKYNVPLEINLLGIRDHRNYPNPLFWQIAGEEKCPVVFGFDSHDVENVYDRTSLEQAKDMVRKYHLYYIGMPNLVSL